MIKEICQFVEILEEQAPDLIEEGAKLKEGIYVALDIGLEDGKYVLKNVDDNGNILEEDIGHYKGEMNYKFSEIRRVMMQTPAVSVNKSFNSSYKLFISSCNPFVIGFSKKNFANKLKEENSEERIINGLHAFFKASLEFVNEDNRDTLIIFQNGLVNNFWKLMNEQVQLSKLKIDSEIVFYLKSIPPSILRESYSSYLKKRLFTKEEYNLTLNNETWGIADNISSFPEKKLFRKHQTAFFNLNYRITTNDVLKISSFYNMLGVSLPNPLPIVVNIDEAKEINTCTFQLFNGEDKVTTYSEIIKNLYKRFEINLQNFYLIFAQNKQVIDLDFVPVFRYKLEEKIYNLMGIHERNDFKLDTVFDLEKELNKVFTKNHRETGKGYGFLIGNYFTDKVESQKPFKQYNVQREILAAFYKYRFSIYEYIYKSKMNAITSLMFDDMMLLSIQADINCDEFKDNFHSKDYAIKEKLNLWFSLYTFFELNQNLKRTDMRQNLRQHHEMMQKLIAGDYNLNNDEEFAFASGQIIYYILSKSVSSDKSYSKLEPFLQKTDCSSYKQSIVRIFDMYKHENFTTKFSKCMAQVMDFDTDRNMKELTPFMLAGFFSENLLFSDNNQQ